MKQKDFNENFCVIYNAVNGMLEHLQLVDDSIPNDMDITKLSIKSIGETLRAVMLNLGTVQNEVNKLYKDEELERACNNQAYDFIMTENLIGRFGLFGHCYPVETYLNKTGLDILEKYKNK